MPAWTCAPCKRDFVSQAARTAHISNSPRHPRCEVCKRGFLDEASKLQHMHSSAVHRHTYCGLCDRHFGSPNALEQHRQNAAVHRFSPGSESGSDAGWSTDSYPGLLPADDSDEESSSTRSEVSATERNTDNETTMTFAEYLLQHLASSAPSGSIETSDPWSSSAGDYGSYLDVSSEEEDDTSSEEEEMDSDFLERSSDSESDTSETPLSLASDLHRSTITRTPIPRSSASPQAPSSALRASFSAATSASSCTPASEHTPSSPGVKIYGPKPKVLGSGYTCPLCLDQDGDPALELSSVRCGHVFCTPCITRALERKHQCPVCRAPAKLKHLRRIFLSF